MVNQLFKTLRFNCKIIYWPLIGLFSNASIKHNLHMGMYMSSLSYNNKIVK